MAVSGQLNALCASKVKNEWSSTSIPRYTFMTDKNNITFTSDYLLPHRTVNNWILLLDFSYERLLKFARILQEPVSNERPKKIVLKREVYYANYYGRTRKLLETEGKGRNCLCVLQEGIRMLVVVVVV